MRSHNRTIISRFSSFTNGNNYRFVSSANRFQNDMRSNVMKRQWHKNRQIQKNYHSLSASSVLKRFAPNIVVAEGPDTTTNAKLSLGGAIAALLIITKASSTVSTATTDTEGSSESKDQKDDKEKKEREEGDVFDIAEKWIGDVTKDAEQFINELVVKTSSSLSKEEEQQGPKEEKKETREEKWTDQWMKYIKDNVDNETSTSSSSSSSSVATKTTFTSILMNTIKGSPKQEEKTVRDLIELARDVVSSSSSSSSSSTISDENNNKTGSFLPLLKLFDTSLQEISSTLESNFSHLQVWKLFDPTSLYYYLEYEDSVKTPSWKRRVHRYHGNVNVQDVRELNDQLYLAELAYADSVDEIKEGLKIKGGWELAYCQMESLPGKPSHYLALRSTSLSEKNSDSPYLDVLLVARGTKTLSDIFTDAMLDTTTYRDGLAHAGVLKSGLYLANRHIKLIETLQKASNKSKVKLTLVGHSLGAGAVTIAGMEFRKNNPDMYDVSVTGFGCPALVSKDLSEEMKDFVTTVVVDSDVIPRMSAASIANVMLNVMEYDWTNSGRRDVQQALEELSKNATTILSPSTSSSGVNEAMKMVDRVIDAYIRPAIKPSTTKRMMPILFPPGTCIHFYRDGRGISGSRAPCDFFGEVDVTRTMLDDHTIDDGYRRIFLDLMREVMDDQHFSFEDDGSTKKRKKQ